MNGLGESVFILLMRRWRLVLYRDKLAYFGEIWYKPRVIWYSFYIPYVQKHPWLSMLTTKRMPSPNPKSPMFHFLSIFFFVFFKHWPKKRWSFLEREGWFGFLKKNTADKCLRKRLLMWVSVHWLDVGERPNKLKEKSIDFRCCSTTIGAIKFWPTPTSTVEVAVLRVFQGFPTRDSSCGRFSGRFLRRMKGFFFGCPKMAGVGFFKSFVCLVLT